MSFVRKAVLALALAPVLALAANAEEHKGLAVLKAKCFQCHTDAMWRDHRQDARGWEATIYRMVGRGGLWTTEEIKLMADYLGTDFGPNAPRTNVQAR